MQHFHSYDPTAGHGLPHDPIKAILAPRPIGWISSVSSDGIANLAPYSFFSMLASKPPLVAFSSDGSVDSVANIAATGAFVHNFVSRSQLNAMNWTSIRFPPEIDEFEAAGLEKIAGEAVGVPRVAGAPAAFECRLVELKPLFGLEGLSADATLVIGQVVRVHIDKAYLRDGLFDMTGAQPIARCGYRGLYAEVDSVFEMLRPAYPGP